MPPSDSVAHRENQVKYSVLIEQPALATNKTTNFNSVAYREKQVKYSVLIEQLAFGISTNSNIRLRASLLIEMRILTFVARRDFWVRGTS